MEIDRQSPDIFLVTVKDDTTTRHEVRVRDSYAEKLDTSSKEDLVRRSFEFLLEKEPNTSILREFDLEEITDYFPEYEDEIR